ncbi:HAD superfamily hydrolase (TIGR01509 family) [Arcanobacterium pluranimalium]|uniref:HAD-IA family hydrolase n=1 Tax=Arcanobacterium pluranimalium TaxID=108028 RepID=UPI00195F2020|nr:HAD superfamily hydrolase (TIGR01509 family) [Arcanobacterium pluranimalium]
MTLPAAILFDMDGTLTDSEQIWFRAETELFEDLGKDFDMDMAKNVIGMSIVDSTEYLAQIAGGEISAREIQDRLLEKVTTVAARDGLPWRPGAYELLELTVTLGIPTALVTSSFLSFAQYALDRAPAGSLHVAVTGDRVSQGKPHPLPYLMAADELGVDINKCMAFEDSIPGLTSAYRSGAMTVGIPFQVELPKFEGSVFIESLVDVDEQFLRQQMASRHDA